MNLIDSRCLQFFILYGLVFMLVQGAFENFELKRTPTICEKACIGGACIYSDCVDVQATCPEVLVSFYVRRDHHVLVGDVISLNVVTPHAKGEVVILKILRTLLNMAIAMVKTAT